MRFVLNLLLVLSFSLPVCGSLSAQNPKKLAEKYYKAKEYQKAFDQYNLIKNIEKDKVALAKRGICSYQINQLIAASKDLTTAYQLGNTQAELKYYMGRINHSMRKYEDAIFFYKSYIRDLKASEEIRPDVAKAIKNCFSGMQFGYKDDEDIGLVENAGNIVNSADDEINPVPSPSFVNRYHFSSNRAQDNFDLFSAEQLEGTWKTAHLIHSSLNTENNELLQDCSLDGSVMVFLRGDDSGSNRLYLNRYSESKHNQRVIFSETKAVSGDTDVYLVNDETMIFASNREGGYGGYDLYISTFSTSGWSDPVNLGPEINSNYNDRYPFMSEKQDQLFFSSDNPNSIGGFDIFSASKKGDEWGEIVSYDFPLNSPEDDIQFRIQEEGFQAYLSSNRRTDTHGGYDIFTVYLRQGYQVHTSEPKQPLSLIKSSVKDEEYAYDNSEELRKEEERLAAEKLAEEKKMEEERIAAEKLAEEERLEEEKMAAEKLAEDKRLEEERMAAEKLAEEKRLEEERMAAEKLAEEKRLEEERLAAEKLAEEKRLEEERMAAEKLAEEKRLEEERMAAEKLAEEKRLEEERMAAEKLAEEQRLEEERMAAEKLAEEKRLEEERRAAEKLAEEKRLEEERMAAEKLAKEQQEEKERLIAERLAEEEKREEERLAAEKMAEQKRMEEERLAAEKLAEEKKMEDERMAAEKLAEEKRMEEERLAAEKMEQEKRMEEERLEAQESKQQEQVSNNAEIAAIELNPIFFESDVDIMTSDNKKIIDKNIKRMKDDKSSNIIISSYSLQEGLPEFELMFCIKRAEKIAEYMIGKGIDRDRIVLKGLGSYYPYVKKLPDPESNSQVENYNNRIDLTLVDASAESVVVQPDVEERLLSTKYEIFQTVTEDVYFRVFLHETNKKMYKNAVLRLYNDLMIESDLSNPSYVYSVGLYTDFKSAFELKRELENKKFSDARIIAYYKGIKISNSDAKLLMGDYPELANFIEINQ